MKNFILILTCLVITHPSLVAKEFQNEKRIQEYFDLLSYEKTDFEPVGAVCERVAVRELEPNFPDQNFLILNGLQYDDKKATIGELDVVIINKLSNKVDAVAEVKCWRSFEGALKKAKNQRMRFQLYLNRSIVISDKNGNRYSKDQFSNVNKYFSISQQGGVNQGFDFELSLDFKELMELRSRLLNCKSEGRCPRRK